MVAMIGIGPLELMIILGSIAIVVVVLVVVILGNRSQKPTEKCPKCGKSSSPSDFCPHCGAKSVKED